MSNHKVNASSGDSHPKPDLNELEMVFGTPSSPKFPMKPNVHLIENEKKHDREHGDHQNGKDSTHPSQPLLEPDKEPFKPPLAGPEVDDLDSGAGTPTDHAPFPGIDDGLLEPIDKSSNGEDSGETDKVGEDGEHSDPGMHDDGTNTLDGKWWLSTDEPDYPYDGLSPRFGEPGSPTIPFDSGASIPDVNTYQQKKNLAQGMMDLALLSANANQLRYVVESTNNHPYFFPSVALISLSIILQIAVGVGLIMNSRYNVKDDKDICKADKINNMTVLGVFLVTIVNVFITSFSVASPPTVVTISDVQQAG